MHKAILVVLAASGLAALGAAPAEAVGTRYPFCLQGDEYPGLSYCTFTSYEQCQATASGRFLTCIANPYYAIARCPAARCRPLLPVPADTERPRRMRRAGAQLFSART
jgi:hypothetical protein